MSAGGQTKSIDGSSRQNSQKVEHTFYFLPLYRLQHVYLARSTCVASLTIGSAFFGSRHCSLIESTGSI